MSPNSLTVRTPLCQGLGRKERSKACRAGTCHRANGTEVMDRSVLPDATVILPLSPRQGLSRASQHCKILKSIPVSLIYDQSASKSGLTLPVHLSLSLQKSTEPFANLFSPLFFPACPFPLRGLEITH